MVRVIRLGGFVLVESIGSLSRDESWNPNRDVALQSRLLPAKHTQTYCSGQSNRADVTESPLVDRRFDAT